MTVNPPARPRPLGVGTLLLWLLGAAVAFVALFFVITLVLRQMPDPVGPRADLFVQGAWTTLSLTLVSGAIGLVVGTLLGIAKNSSNFLVNAVPTFIVWILRGTPLLLQILFAYNALPLILKALHIPVSLNEYWSAVIALAMNVGAYNAEVIRAGIQAVPRGQSEAARALGLSSTKTMTSVILPQAFRLTIPPLVNNLTALLKDSSLAFSISVLEIMNAGSRVTSETFQFIPVYITIGAVYLTLTTALTFFTNILERRLKIVTR